MQDWLRRARHDLVKPLVWTARDLVDLGRPLLATDLAEMRRALGQLIDQAGTSVTMDELWRQLRTVAPVAIPAGALDRFEQALQQVALACHADAQTAADALLALEPAFEQLAQSAAGTTA